MASRRVEVERLHEAVAVERRTTADERLTRASDKDLEGIDRLLDLASLADSPAERQALRGRISRTVIDTWSFDAALSADLVAFDDGFLVPP